MFEDAIGRIETAEDIIDETRLMQAAAMLGLGAEGAAIVKDKSVFLPPLFHLFFGNNASDQSRLDHEGHEKLGAFIPDVTKAGDFQRRMWAAGDIRFQGQLKKGEALKRQTTIRSIEAKEGRTGALIFVTVDRALETASGRVDETRVIVYRKASDAPAPDSIPIDPDPMMQERATWTPDAVQLFRFSSLTWNGHKIHFDVDHCRDVEFYPDLITHGPFTAMMLANLRRDGLGFTDALRDGNPLNRFKFRGTQALYANRKVSLCSNDQGDAAEARNHLGQQAMTALIEVR